MPIQEINVGSGPGAGNGETLYNAFVKVNANTVILDTNNAAALTAAQVASQVAGDASTAALTAKNTADNAAAAVATKAPINSPTFTGTVGGVTKAMVGLPLADNTSDLNKPVSNAQDIAITTGDIERLKVSDVYKDFIVSGLLVPTVPSGPTSISAIIAVGVAYVNGKRVIKDTTTAKTFSATRDTYIDIDSSGNLYYQETSNGIAPSAPVAGRLRLQKVVTNATVITSIATIAPIAILNVPGNSVTVRTNKSMFPGEINAADILEVPSENVLYIDKATSLMWRWNGVAYVGAAFDIDPLGNIVANINHNIDTTTNLLSIMGGDGEISVSNSEKALVVYRGTTAGAGTPLTNGFKFNSAKESHELFLGITSTTTNVSSTTYTRIPFTDTLGFDLPANGGINILGANNSLASDRILNPFFNKSDCIVEIEGLFQFGASAKGTARNLRIGGTPGPTGDLTWSVKSTLGAASWNLFNGMRGAPSSTPTITATGNTFVRTTGSWITDGHTIGDIVRFTGFTDASGTGGQNGLANNNVDYRIVDITALVVTMDIAVGATVSTAQTVTCTSRGTTCVQYVKLRALLDRGLTGAISLDCASDDGIGVVVTTRGGIKVTFTEFYTPVV